LTGTACNEHGTICHETLYRRAATSAKHTYNPKTATATNLEYEDVPNVPESYSHGKGPGWSDFNGTVGHTRRAASNPFSNSNSNSNRMMALMLFPSSGRWNFECVNTAQAWVDKAKNTTHAKNAKNATVPVTVSVTVTAADETRMDSETAMVAMLRREEQLRLSGSVQRLLVSWLGLVCVYMARES
jgi:hypothetical protein